METKKISSPEEVKKAVADFFKEQNITMADAGVAMGMSRASVSYALSVKEKYFTNAQAVKYARCFKMDIDFLTKGIGELMDKDPRYARNLTSHIGGRVAFEDMTPDMQEMALRHENYRYRRALSDISNLSIILDVLEKADKANEEDFQRLNDEIIDDAVFQEKRILFLRKRKEIQCAISYAMEKINSATSIANSIEVQRTRRENPELWRKIDAEQKEKGTESTARRLLDTYLNGTNSSFNEDVIQDD